MESLNSVVSKPLDMLHHITIEAFVDSNVGIVLENFGEGPDDKQ